MPERIGNFSFEVSDSRITGFTISSLDLSSIPQQVFSFSNLRSLFVESPKLNEIPPEIHNLQQLQSLLIGSSVYQLPPELFTIVTLQELSLNDNPLGNIPDAIGNLVNLKELKLNRTSLETVFLSFSPARESEVNLWHMIIGIIRNKAFRNPIKFRTLQYKSTGSMLPFDAVDTIENENTMEKKTGKKIVDTNS